jgi:hypothetical protein
MPDLLTIGRDTLEMQQRHEGFQTRIDFVAVGLRTHCSFSRVSLRSRVL